MEIQTRVTKSPLFVRSVETGENMELPRLTNV